MGTLINAGAVIIGSLIGPTIHKRFPERIAAVAFQAIGVFTLFLGISMASKTGNFLVMVFSIVGGSIIGELLNIEKRVEGFSRFLKGAVRSGNDHFSEGFVTSFLLFCMGSMTILGAIEEGLGGRPESSPREVGARRLFLYRAVGVPWGGRPLFSASSARLSGRPHLVRKLTAPCAHPEIDQRGYCRWRTAPDRPRRQHPEDQATIGAQHASQPGNRCGPRLLSQLIRVRQVARIDSGVSFCLTLQGVRNNDIVL